MEYTSIVQNVKNNIISEGGKMKKQLLLVGLTVLLICVGLSGCINTESDDKNNLEIKTEIIMITGNYIERTVHYLDNPVELRVTGNYCDIIVTEETNLIAVWVTGNYNVLQVSKNHSFNPSIAGTANNVIYYDLD